MRAVCWEGKEKIQVETVPVPRPPVRLRSTSTTTLVNGGLTSGQGSAERQPGYSTRLIFAQTARTTRRRHALGPTETRI